MFARLLFVISLGLGIALAWLVIKSDDRAASLEEHWASSVELRDDHPAGLGAALVTMYAEPKWNQARELCITEVSTLVFSIEAINVPAFRLCQSKSCDVERSQKAADVDGTNGFACRNMDIARNYFSVGEDITGRDAALVRRLVSNMIAHPREDWPSVGIEVSDPPVSSFEPELLDGRPIAAIEKWIDFSWGIADGLLVIYDLRDDMPMNSIRSIRIGFVHRPDGTFKVDFGFDID